MRILLIGLPAAGRLRSVTDALGEFAASAPIEAADSIARFRSAGLSGAPLDLILVFQDWPEQHTPSEVDWLLSHHPTTRILCVYGGWCESDGRTRGVWPHAVRVPQWRLRPRLLREIQVVAGRARPLPFTASRRERFLFEHSPLRESHFRTPLVVRIVTPDRAFGETLAAHIGGTGQNSDPPDIVVFDVDPWNMATRSQLEEHARRNPGARIVALSGFPNHVPVDEIRAAGAAAVLPKLLTADMLSEFDDT